MSRVIFHVFFIIIIMSPVIVTSFLSLLLLGLRLGLMLGLGLGLVLDLGLGLVLDLDLGLVLDFFDKYSIFH